MPEILDEGGGFLLDEAGVLDYILDEAGADVAAGTAQGGWWQLLSVNRYREQEFAFYASQPPLSCPRCGEPWVNAPPTDSGAAVELFCRFDGFRYPEDGRGGL